MAAALTLATACSNEEDNNIVPQPLLEAETTQPAVVKVPFSVKVDNGKQSLKKIKCEPKQDFSEMTFAFEDEDVEETQYILRVYDDTYDYLPDDYQYLSLTKINDEFVFAGELDVIEGKEESFANGDCELWAVLSTYSKLQREKDNPGMGMVASKILQNTSLGHLLDLQSTFKSNDETIQLKISDSKAYLYVDGVPDGFSFSGGRMSKSNCSLTNGNWFSFAVRGTNVDLTITYTESKSESDSESDSETETPITTTKTIEPGHLYIFDLVPKVKPTPEPIPTPVPRG